MISLWPETPLGGFVFKSPCFVSGPCWSFGPPVLLHWMSCITASSVGVQLGGGLLFWGMPPCKGGALVFTLHVWVDVVPVRQALD